MKRMALVAKLAIIRRMVPLKLFIAQHTVNGLDTLSDYFQVEGATTLILAQAAACVSFDYCATRSVAAARVG